MGNRLFAALVAFALLVGVCSHDVRPAFASAPYEGDSATTADGLLGVNTYTTNGGLGVHGKSGTNVSNGAGVMGEDSHGGWGVWGQSTLNGGSGVYGMGHDQGVLGGTNAISGYGVSSSHPPQRLARRDVPLIAQWSRATGTN